MKDKNALVYNLYQSNEAIVTQMVDKLIYLTIRTSYSNKIESQLGNFCFNYLKNNINNMFEPLYLPHTKGVDNSKSNLNNDNNAKELFWKIKQPEKNTWVEIIEPEVFEMDRYEGSNIKFKEIEKYEEVKDKEIDKSNKKNIENSLKNKISHHKSNFTKNNNNYLKMSNKSVRIDFIDKKESNKNLLLSNKLLAQNLIQNQNISEKNIPQNTNTNNISNKNKKIQIIDFPSMDIPDIDEDNIQKYDLPEAELLRKEYQESLIKKQEEDLKIKQEEEKEKKLQKIIQEKKSKKIFDSNKLTFDSDGKIISFKQFKIDGLKDFIIPKNIIKEAKKTQNENSNTSKKKSTNFSIISKTPVKVKVKEEEIIKNILVGQNKSDKIFEKIEKIIPSGSNFKVISPGIGVVITENGQYKEGSREFSKYFKKYSLKDYDKILNDYLPNINDNLLKTSLGNKTSRNLRHSILNLNNTSKRNSIKNISKRNSKDTKNIINNEEIIGYNPLMSSQNKENELLEKDINTNINNSSNNKTIDIQNSNILSSRAYSKNNPLLSSFNNTMNKNLNTTSFDKFITMKKSGISSLKLELDSLKDLNLLNNGQDKNALTTRYNNDDIIGNKFRIKNHSLIHRQIKYRNDFGDFNKKILSNKKWGNEISQNINNNINTVYSKHQSKIQILRELGSNILSGFKIKLPRNRKVDLVKNVNI